MLRCDEWWARCEVWWVQCGELTIPRDVSPKGVALLGGDGSGLDWGFHLAAQSEVHGMQFEPCSSLPPQKLLAVASSPTRYRITSTPAHATPSDPATPSALTTPTTPSQPVVYAPDPTLNVTFHSASNKSPQRPPRRHSNPRRPQL